MPSTGVLALNNYPDHFEVGAIRSATVTSCDSGDVFILPLAFAPSLPTDGGQKRYRWVDRVSGVIAFTAGTVANVTAKIVEVTMPITATGANWSLVAAVASGSAAAVTDLSAAVAVTDRTVFEILPSGTAMDGNRVTPGRMLALMVLFGATSSGGTVQISADAAVRTRAQ